MKYILCTLFTIAYPVYMTSQIVTKVRHNDYPMATSRHLYFVALQFSVNHCFMTALLSQFDFFPSYLHFIRKGTHVFNRDSFFTSRDNNVFCKNFIFVTFGSRCYCCYRNYMKSLQPVNLVFIA